MKPILRLQGESLVAVWARRCVTIPLYWFITSSLLSTLPLLLFMTSAVDLCFSPARLWPRTRALLFLCLYFVVEIVGVCFSTIVWLKFKIVPGSDEAFISANAALQRRFTDALFYGAVRIFSLRIEVSGEEHAASGPFLLLVRHSSTADTVLAAALLANPHQRLLKYVLKRELLADPCLDIVGRRLPNAFVERSRQKQETRSPHATEADLAAVALLARDLDEHTAILIFPEGTRFSARKLEAAKHQLGAHPELAELAEGFSHILPPKLGGTLALLNAAPDVDVVFLEHTGFEGAESFGRFFAGAMVGNVIRARIRRVAAADIPKERRDVWLFKQWLECERFVAANQSLEHA